MLRFYCAYFLSVSVIGQFLAFCLLLNSSMFYVTQILQLAYYVMQPLNRADLLDAKYVSGLVEH